MGTQIIKISKKMLTTIDRNLENKRPNVGCIISTATDLPDLTSLETLAERIRSHEEIAYDKFINEPTPASFQFPKLKLTPESMMDISPSDSPNTVKKILVRPGLDLENDELKCENGKEVTVKYTGFIPTVQNREPTKSEGSIFDSSSLHADGPPFKLTVGKNMVVKGFEAGVASMRKGEVAVIYFASHMGYGSRGGGPIPADSSLGFVLHVTEVTTKLEGSTESDDMDDDIDGEFPLEEIDIDGEFPLEEGEFPLEEAMAEATAEGGPAGGSPCKSSGCCHDH